MFEQAAAARVMIIAGCRRPLEFLAVLAEIGLAKHPQPRIAHRRDHGRDIVPIAFERRAAFGRAGEKLHHFLLLQAAHTHAVDVQPILIPPEGAVEAHAIAVLEIVESLVGVAVLPNLEFLDCRAVGDFDVEIGLARLGHILARLCDLARHFRLNGASIG